MLEVLGEMDARHATAAELALDAVTIGQGGRESARKSVGSAVTVLRIWAARSAKSCYCVLLPPSLAVLPRQPTRNQIETHRGARYRYRRLPAEAAD